jgi:peptidoglycan/LPS O-acetylase OafA/YrhL
MKLSPAMSAYLDFLRFLAALAVLLGHMDLDGLSLSWMPLALFSHDAVVIFFVLSGFIIYYSTTSRASTWRHYAVARMSRIYSVALPSVLLCAGLALWLSSQPGFDPARYSNYTPPSLWNMFSSLLFLNESWLNQADVPLNNPYWSLCYEVWYYILFGVFYFWRGTQRVVLLVIASLIAGPAILVLLPVWTMGAVLAASQKYETSWGVWLAWLAFSVPVGLIVLIKLTGADTSVQSVLYESIPGFWRLDGSQRFVTDYLIGLALCLHIAAFSSLPSRVQAFFVRQQTPMAALAGFSFTLYLFHRPMTQVLGALWPQTSGTVLVPAIMTMVILLACWFISWGTEKQLPRWRNGFARLLQPQP